jgi:hypothetical protein
LSRKFRTIFGTGKYGQRRMNIEYPITNIEVKDINTGPPVAKPKQ